MLKWLKKISRRKSLTNILEILPQLIEVSNRALYDIQQFGNSKPEDRKLIHNLQTELVIQLCGPLPLDRIKADIIEPLLAKLGNNEGPRRAIEHVYAEFDKRNISWNKEAYDAYEELLADYKGRLL